MLNNIHMQRKQQGPTVTWKGNVNDEKWALCVDTEMHFLRNVWTEVDVILNLLPLTAFKKLFHVPVIQIKNES